MPFTTTNQIKVYYEMHGQGEPLFFLNGLSSDIAQKKLFIDEVKKHYQVIVPDIRGAGQTDKPQAHYTISEFAGDAYALLKELDINKIRVMGFSMGGFIAQELALTHPEVVSELILVATKPAWLKPLAPSKRAHDLLHSEDYSMETLIEMFDVIYGKQFKEKVSAQEYAKEKLSMPNPQPAHGYLGQLHACENFDVANKLTQIKQPTLIVTGTADELIQPENSQWMHKQIPNSKLIEYPEIGHMVVDECPERLVRDTQNFLR
ncbi:MAG: alpha/beta hydrolase [bacterium]|nr:alpha/beta hydrolase [bacterium]MBU1917468.1 alpha/beta hydrolase [bacterium]